MNDNTMGCILFKDYARVADPPPSIPDKLAVEWVELDADGCCTGCGRFLWAPNDASGTPMIAKFCPDCGKKIKR